MWLLCKHTYRKSWKTLTFNDNFNSFVFCDCSCYDSCTNISTTIAFFRLFYCNCTSAKWFSIAIIIIFSDQWRRKLRVNACCSFVPFQVATKSICKTIKCKNVTFNTTNGRVGWVNEDLDILWISWKANTVTSFYSYGNYCTWHPMKKTWSMP